ncbi:MAG: ABC-F family ATP-binding cassette domain-containing protein [Smithellaceae bacterium]|nr:ABC-F family ATP-binding cassette domain-containing protein [Smithellaceae bacterium]
MIYLNNISLSFGEKQLFASINWTITDRSRIGLVGDNGTGKTTLFRTIMGLVDLDEGAIDIPNLKNRTLGYLPQDLVELESVNLITYLKNKSGLAELEQEIGSCEKLIASPPPGADSRRLLKNYEDATHRFESKNGYAFEAKAKQILKGMGFQERDFDKSCEEFSGGWKMRIMLATILLAEPDVMLLDEPTNHLDTESMEWLEAYLKNYQGTVITVSHDRFFLDKIVTQIAELANQKITLYKGNYSYFLKEKERRLEALKKEMELQKAELKKTQEFIERFRYKATKAKQVQSRIKALEKFAPIQMAEGARTVRIKFPEGPKSGREVITVADLSKSYGDDEVFRDLNFTVLRGQKIALVGVNGAGKSTLSRILSRTEAPSSGRVTYGLNVLAAFFSQESAENLSYERTVWDEITSAGGRINDQERRNLLGAFLFSGDDIFKPVSVLSGGEKSRLALLKIMLADSNLLILDEPTNHLDLKTKDVFQSALLGYHGTLIIVSHDRYFLDHLIDRVFEIRDGVLHEYHGNYSYFIEKRAQLEHTDAPETETSPREEVPSQSPYRTKEDKRREAEERNRLSRLRSGLKKEIAAAEERIHALETQKASCEELLCRHDTHRDQTLVKETTVTLGKATRELEEIYAKWEKLLRKWEDMAAEE